MDHDLLETFRPGRHLEHALDGQVRAVAAVPDADSTSFGLFSIQERLKHLGGEMRIDSAPGGGARITLLTPLSL